MASQHTTEVRPRVRHGLGRILEGPFSLPPKGAPDGMSPYSPSFGTSVGSCGYGLLDRSSWPFWSVGALSTSNVFYDSLPVSGCGICIEVRCEDRWPFQVCPFSLDMTGIGSHTLDTSTLTSLLPLPLTATGAVQQRPEPAHRGPHRHRLVPRMWARSHRHPGAHLPEGESPR